MSHIQQILAFTAVLLSATATTAHSDALLQRGDGKWSGKGTARASADATPESVRCRFDNRYDAATGRLSVSGRCAAAGETQTVNGWIEPTHVAGNYRGSWRNPAGPGNISAHGSAKSNQVTLAYRTKNPDGGEMIDGAVVWRFLPDALTMTVFAGESGARKQIGAIALTR